jgi:hypothetical protein
MCVKRASAMQPMFYGESNTGVLDITLIPMEEFALKWRFTDPRYRALPPVHLKLVKPLSPMSSRRLWDLALPLHEELPFTAGFFRVVESIPLDNAAPTAVRGVRKWLFSRGVPFKSLVFLSYQPEWAIATTWKMVVKYWDDFWYPGSDDLTVVDGSFAWALLLWHESQAFFGDNRNRPDRGRTNG